MAKSLTFRKVCLKRIEQIDVGFVCLICFFGGILLYYIIGTMGKSGLVFFLGGGWSESQPIEFCSGHIDMERFQRIASYNQPSSNRSPETWHFGFSWLKISAPCFFSRSSGCKVVDDDFWS